MLSKERLDFVTFDVFTQTPFKGNPLAIVKVPLGFLLSKSQKQAIAREFNFSETVFLHQGEREASRERKIDIFTTTEELPFAGHPTIGTICSIATNADPDLVEELTLLTKAGPIHSKYDHRSFSAIASIPHNVHIHHDSLECSRVERLVSSVENKPYDDLLDLWPSDPSGLSLTFPVVSVVKGMTFILIGFPQGGGQLEKLQVGRQLTYAETLSLDKEWLPSFIAPYFYEILSEQEGKTLRIRARMIEPTIGEDPATGSAACTLAAYIALQRGEAGMTYRFNIEQGVEMARDSNIGVEISLDEHGRAVKEIHLSGSAVQVTEGTIML
ncbi:MAG: hypothetical protein Q9195_003778 [Heterodermia aff. obscurata]